MADQRHGHRHQQGMVLVIGLIILLLMTLIGVTAIQTTTLDEKMVGNASDRNLAFQAAEAALRDAELDLYLRIPPSGDPNTPGVSGITDFTPDCGNSTSSDDDNGLCYNGPSGYSTPIWMTADMTGAPSVEYLQFKPTPPTPTPLPNVSAQPRYLIEGFKKNVAGQSGSQYYYRITVRAQGANPNTVVWLQTLYKP